MSKKKLTCSRKDCNGCAKERTEAHCTCAKTTLFTSMLGPNEHHVGITVVLWERNPMDSSEEKALYPFISPEKRTEKLEYLQTYSTCIAFYTHRFLFHVYIFKDPAGVHVFAQKRYFLYVL